VQSLHHDDLDLSIPHFCLTSHNITSLSAHASTPSLIARHQSVINHITLLLQLNDIICLQETHLGSLEQGVLSLYFPDHLVFYNNLQHGRGGTLVIVTPKFARRFIITEVPLHPDAKGRVQVLKFSSRSHPSHARSSFCLINVYLTSGHCSTSMARKYRELRTLRAIPSGIPNFLVGDWNFVEHTEDSPSRNTATFLRGLALREWERLVARLRLTEIHQPTHTYWHLSSDPNHSASSRLDRGYSSLSTAELSLVNPSAFIPHTTYCPSSAFLPNPQKARRSKKLRFDHVPVSLVFSSTETRNRSRFSVPRWLVKVPGFAAHVELLWKGRRANENPFEALDRWKEAVREVCRLFFLDKQSASTFYGDDLALLGRAIHLFRSCSRSEPDLERVHTLMRAHSRLEGTVVVGEDDSLDTSRLARLIERLTSEELVSGSHATPDSGFDDPEIELPPSLLPSSGCRSNPIDAIKSRLPSTRKPLTHLRATPISEPTSDPQVMGEIIANYHQRIWKVSDEECSTAELDDYMEDYDKRISPQLTPSIPSVDDFFELIDGSNDSSAGPDGIPFAMFRAYNRRGPELAEVLRDITVWMASGSPPPPGYNHALLFLIPKKATMLVEDTRPISVTNADNRIIAKAFTNAITPALQLLLDPDQKGFVPHRVGTEHVHQLTQNFYSRLRAKEQHYILLLDTARAFDSVSHSFIHACLERVGMPLWVCEMMRGMLDDVQVAPVLSAATEHRIPILRGVKQGCPASPLIFALCFDVLLHRLREHTHDTQRFAFADDLAISSDTVLPLINSLRIISSFSYHSGLGLNIHKTSILPALPPNRLDLARLERAGWGEISLSCAEKYLGVMVGRTVTTEDVFREAHSKFNERVALFRRIIQSSSLHQRILIFNVFLLPIFYYLAQFYIIPWASVVVPVTRVCRQLIIPYNGGGFTYAHLITPRGHGFGPHTPLRDLWSTNYTLLSAPFTFEDSHLSPYPVMGEMSRVVPYRYMNGSMRPDEHSAYAAFELLEDHSPRSNALIDMSDLPPSDKPAARRRFLYTQLSVSGYWQKRSCKDRPTSMQNKLARLLPPNIDKVDAVRHLCSHATAVGRRATPAVWNYLLRLVSNSTPFEVRRRQAKMDVTSRLSPSSRHSLPCYLCGVGRDSLRHVMCRCPVVVGARAVLEVKMGIAFPSSVAHVLLCTPPSPSAKGLDSLLSMIFNYVVWGERKFACSLASPLARDVAIRRLVRITLHRLPVDGGGKSKPEEAAVVQLATHPPADCIVGFADGSAIPNPGPCGAGYTLAIPGRPLLERSEALGMGDNNIGEMGALSGLFRLLLVERDMGHTPGSSPLHGSEAAQLQALPIRLPRAIFFSDSALCCGFLSAGWKCPHGIPLAMARETRRLHQRLSGFFRVTLYWIRGHTGIPGNDRADTLAKEGAFRSRAQQGPR
jgi:ribonuclease HI/exonuclease III